MIGARLFVALLLLTLGPAGFAQDAPSIDGSQAPEKGVEVEEGGEAPELAKEFRDWLEEVDLLITDEEREYFLSLRHDFRRRAFIEGFWDQRDIFDDTRFNELRQRWQERSARVRSELGGFDDARAQILLLNGEPFNRCRHRLYEIELWFYAGSEAVDESFVLVFDRPSRKVPYRLWRTGQSFLRTARPRPLTDLSLAELCTEERIAVAFDLIAKNPFYEAVLLDVMKPPIEPSQEWVATFAARSTEIAADAEPFPAELTFRFPGRHQQRTVVQGVVTVPGNELATFDSERGRQHQVLVTGEVVRAGELFERFRYRFEVPSAVADAAGSATVPLVFQRYLRPGEVTVMVKVEDLQSRRVARLEQTFEIPTVDEQAPRPKPAFADAELLRFFEEAEAATARGERVVRLLQPPGVVHTGLVRFKTLTVGDVDKVSFLLDGKEILTKNRPPFTVELDLGAIPGVHRLRALAFDAAGAEVATDEILLNPGGQRFRVRLVEPYKGARYERSLRAVADVEVPDGAEVERLEFYLNEDLVATLYQPPWIQPIVLGGAELAYVRAVAYLPDGNSSEELVYVNAPDFMEEIEVQFVELYATVADGAGRPVLDLPEERFTVLEDGIEQQIRRFEWVSDLPVHAALLIDNSSSMEDSIEQVGEAALAFVEQAIQPRDRAALITFTGSPEVAVRFTNDAAALKAALRGMRAEGGTALYDSLIFALHYFHGVKGQKALLLLSDGRDEASSFDVDGALEFARRAGVAIYAIGLAEALERGARKVLTALAEETGGRSFFVEDLAELGAIYAAIQEELRAQYLIAYQSSSARPESEFRRVEVEVEADDKLEVRTMSGYYP